MALGRAHVTMPQKGAGVKRILARRAALPVLHGGYATVIPDPGDARIFAVARQAPMGTMLCLFNFSEEAARVPAGWCRAEGVADFFDELSDRPVRTESDNVALPPYARVWLR